MLVQPVSLVVKRLLIGHGGAGMCVSYGCANEVVKHVDAFLGANKRGASKLTLSLRSTL